MYQDILQSLGLSPNEAKIYESLVEIGEASISDISTRSQTHRRNAYDAIKRLIDKGLVSERFSGPGKRYKAVEPDKLMDLLAEQEARLRSVLPELNRKFHQHPAPEEAYIYRGLEGQKNLFRDVLRVGQDSYIVGAKGDWFDQRLETSRQVFFREANRKNLKFHILFDHEIREAPSTFVKTYPATLEHRFLPEAYSSSSLFHLFGDYVVTYSSGSTLFKTPESTVFFVLHSRDLAESYLKWFWYMWHQSSEKTEERKTRNQKLVPFTK